MFINSINKVIQSNRSRIQIRNAAKITSIHSIPSIKTKPPVVKHTIEERNKRRQLLERPGIFGIKRGMITWFTSEGEQLPATVIEIDSVEVLQHKTEDEFGYNSILLGTIDRFKNLKLGLSTLKIFDKAGTAPKYKIGEFRIRNSLESELPLGTEIKADYFAEGQLIDVKGITKGKGFAGGMKRWGFKGQPATHGVTKTHRKAGGHGGNQDPGRIFPGHKGEGRMGGKNNTKFNIEVLKTDADAGIIIVKGSIPGPRKAILKLQDSLIKYATSKNQIEKEAM
ncbi:unnamed protein product [Candida verbasci]|uniref:Large ribosomal subunit protein uL3m n=1 Tax=Candida verbasci TaxID=1227364 RepID=A0A9W4XB24_9ASCO|nr:unnamed protein product [Candida verbasci]